MASTVVKDLKDCTNHQLLKMLIPDLEEIVDQARKTDPELIDSLHVLSMTSKLRLCTVQPKRVENGEERVLSRYTPGELLVLLIPDLDERIYRADHELRVAISIRSLAEKGVQIRIR